mmetsp:Transcript_45707/g.147172  ORF Transcript_45707/g.147172 Transcript_45707/m.147172 type:complete len:385 (-) Transcript_45707:822-1976(-)
MAPSNEPEASHCPSGEKVTALTSCTCPVSRAIGFLPAAGAHRKTVKSSEPEASSSAVPRASAYRCAAPAFAAASSAGATSRRRPTSSAKRGARGDAPAAGTSRERERSPENAISRAAVRRPPSETSWPARSVPALRRACVAAKAAASSSGRSTSGGVSPICLYTCASAVPPRRRFPSAMSTSSRAESSALRSGVTVLRTSSHAAYTVTTRSPGALTTRPPTRAAMESESFPPSTATPMAFMKLDMAAHASYMAAPSPSSLAAHIQLAEHFTSPRPPTDAHTRLVTASAVARRAIAAGSSRPLIGCSPTAVAAPEKSVCVWAMTPQFARGMWSGPTHCCCAMRPVTERSTLFVRKRFEPTEGRRRTRPSASATVSPSGRERGLDG